MTDFKTGQKWISNAEPELGMGRVIRLDERTVSLYFDAAAEERMYALWQAPLTRVHFNPGDRITTQDDVTITVNSVVDKNGIFVYHGDYQGTDTAVVETELDANVRFSKPEERLFTHQIDDNRWFNLRYHSLARRARLAESSSVGLYGPRVAPIPHQLDIASEVASRFAPRVLLADEVGLGKTIEAGLILHQQLQTGRARARAGHRATRPDVPVVRRNDPAIQSAVHGSGRGAMPEHRCRQPAGTGRGTPR
ncbi:MAG: hypothetical protein U5O39_12990 [Gammaproteobacteria bacterium]|nr:hypothetical protein [Gammaproteobacteria bacterium]